MPDYRLYYLDRRGHIARAVNVECADDEEAMVTARDRKHPHGIEVWEGARMVGRVESFEG